MVQKQKDKEDSKISDITKGISENVTSSSKTRSVNKSLPMRLKDAIFKEGSVENGVVSGAVTALAGLIIAGIIPTTVLPLLVGFTAGGAVLGKLLPDDVFSVMGGSAVSTFLIIFFSVNVPIFGLGLITTLFLTLISTGAVTAAHQYFSNSKDKY